MVKIMEESMKETSVAEMIGEIMKIITGNNFYCVVLQQGDETIKGIQWATGVSKSLLPKFVLTSIAKECEDAEEFCD